jgi:hypothetical protein
MDFKEGQIYRGDITLSGEGEGKTRDWIIISPFNKIHMHSINNPLKLHCWPLFAAQKGLDAGRLELIETDLQHPVVHLQREKEKLGIPDIHMGLYGEPLEQMINLLGEATRKNKPFAPYMAGEILAFIDRALHSKKEVKSIKKLVKEHVALMDHQSAS